MINNPVPFPEPHRHGFAMRERIAKALEPFAGRVPDQRIELLVDQLTHIGGPANEMPPACFRQISPASAGRELKLIAYHAHKLGDLLDGLHATQYQRHSRCAL